MKGESEALGIRRWALGKNKKRTLRKIFLFRWFANQIGFLFLPSA